MIKEQELEKLAQEILEKYNYNKTYLIEMAFDIQEKIGFIDKEILKIICQKLNIFYSEAYSAISFFKDFRFIPPQKISISVCNGTSCYFNGGKELYENLIKQFKNNQDLEIKTSYCYKCCSQYPVVKINEKIILNANDQKVYHEIEKEIKN